MCGLAAQAYTIGGPYPLRMSIRRPRGPKPALKHLAFLESMMEHTEPSAEWRALRASLLTLRLVDEWMLSAAVIADGNTAIARATRAAVNALHEDSDLQFLLTRVVDGILMPRDADANAVTPRLAALAELYTQRRASGLAADIRQFTGSALPVTAASTASPTEAMA